MSPLSPELIFIWCIETVYLLILYTFISHVSYFSRQKKDDERTFSAATSLKVVKLEEASLFYAFMFFGTVACVALLLWLAAFTALLVFLSFYCYSEFLLLFLTVPYLF